MTLVFLFPPKVKERLEENGFVVQGDSIMYNNQLFISGDFEWSADVTKLYAQTDTSFYVFFLVGELSVTEAKRDSVLGVYFFRDSIYFVKNEFED